MKKNIIIASLILIITYIIISYFLLNGRLYYQTSFYSSDIIDSKERNLFLTSNVEIEKSISIDSIINNTDIWYEKHKVVDYYGFAFHWTTEKEGRKKLRMEYPSKYLNKLCCDIIRNNDTIEYRTIFPLRALEVENGDIIQFRVFDCKGANDLGKLKIIVK